MSQCQEEIDLKSSVSQTYEAGPTPTGPSEYMDTVANYYRRIREIDIGAVAEEILGERVTGKSAAGLVCDCPNHSSQSQRSLHVDLHKQYWYCFGCRKGGDVLQLVEFVKFGVITAGIVLDAVIDIAFSDNLLPRANELDKLVDEIVDVISSLVTSAHDGWIRKCNYEFTGCPLMTKHVSELSYHSCSAGSGTHWLSLHPQDIQVGDSFIAKLDDKICKLPTYRANLPVCPMHLLIHCDDDTESSMSPDAEDVQTALSDWSAASGFDKVWFYAGQHGKAYSIWP